MEGTSSDNGGFTTTSTGEIPPLPIVLYNADTNNWECVSCVTTFQTESQLDAHLQLHNELGRSIITTTPTTPEKFSFDNPSNDLFQSTSFDAPDFDDFINEFEKFTGGGGGSGGEDAFSSEQTYPLIVHDRFISGSSTFIPTTTSSTTYSTVINVPSVINPLLHPPPPPLPPPISQPLPPPPPPVVQIQVGPVPQPLPQPQPPKPRKRYPCSKCSKDFSRPSYLRKHQETNHQHQSPLTNLDTSKMCPICSKGFSTQWHLTQHMKTHTSEMSYCCAHCGKEFSDRENMQRHMEVHKPEVTKPPPPPPPITLDQSFSKLGDRDIAVVNVVASAPKFKSENFKSSLPPPPPPVVDLEEETDVILETDLEPEVDDDEDSDGFECSMCDKIFQTIKQLRIHERMMHEDKLMEVDKHVFNHHSDNPNPHNKFNSIANTLLKNESLLRSMSMSRRNKRKRWSLSTMEKYEYCASLICDIKKKLGKALKILEPGSFDRRLRRKIKKRRRDKDNEWCCKVTSCGIKIYNLQRKSQQIAMANCSSNIYACIVCGLKVNSVTILKRHVLAEHANIIGGPTPSEAVAVPEVKIRSGTPPSLAPLKTFKSTFVGPLSKSPQKQMYSTQKPIGPLPKTISPLSEKTGPLSRAAGPLSKKAGPLSRTAGPLSKTAGPLSRTTGPSTKPIGSHLKPMGPPSQQKGVHPKTTGPASKQMQMGLPPKSIGLPPKPVGPPPKPMGLPPKSIGLPPKPVGLPPTPMGLPPKPVGLPPTPMGLPLKPMGLPPKPTGQPTKPMGPPPNPKPMSLPSKPIGPASNQMGLPPKSMGPPLRPIGHPQKSEGTDDDLIVIYQTVNFSKSPLKPGTGKRTTNFAANQAKKKAERIAAKAALEKAQLAEMSESRGANDNSLINILIYPTLKEFQQYGIYGRVHIKDFQGIRSILGCSRAIVKLTTSTNSRPKLPTPFQRKSEQCLLNDRITIQSASEQARKDRRKSMLLNQPPPVKSSITTRSKSLIKMEKELRVVLTRIDDDSFDFTELLFLNKMC